MKKTVYIISGPTASGKSLIAYYLAKRIRGDISNSQHRHAHLIQTVTKHRTSNRVRRRYKHIIHNNPLKQNGNKMSPAMKAATPLVSDQGRPLRAASFES